MLVYIGFNMTWFKSKAMTVFMFYSYFIKVFFVKIELEINKFNEQSE